MSFSPHILRLEHADVYLFVEGLVSDYREKTKALSKYFFYRTLRSKVFFFPFLSPELQE